MRPEDGPLHYSQRLSLPGAYRSPAFTRPCLGWLSACLLTLASPALAAEPAKWGVSALSSVYQICSPYFCNASPDSAVSPELRDTKFLFNDVFGGEFALVLHMKAALLWNPIHILGKNGLHIAGEAGFRQVDRLA